MDKWPVPRISVNQTAASVGCLAARHDAMLLLSSLQCDPPITIQNWILFQSVQVLDDCRSNRLPLVIDVITTNFCRLTQLFAALLHRRFPVARLQLVPSSSPAVGCCATKLQSDLKFWRFVTFQSCDTTQSRAVCHFIPPNVYPPIQ